MKLTRLVRRLYCLVLITASSFTIYGQSWSLCEGEVAEVTPVNKTFRGKIAVRGLMNEEKEYPYLIDAQIRRPSCPGGEDGQIIIGSILYKKDLLPEPVFAEGDTIKYSVIGVEGTSQHQLKFPIEINDLSSGNYVFYFFARFGFEGVTITIPEVEDPKTRAEVTHESCIGAKDGRIEIKHIGNPPAAPKMDWADGATGLIREGLTFGEYGATYSFDAGGQRCCIDGVVRIGSNFCGSTIASYHFNNGVIEIPFEALPSGCEALNGGVYYAIPDSYWGRLFDPAITGADVIAIAFEWLGIGGEARSATQQEVIINATRTDEIRIPFEGSGDIRMLYRPDGFHVKEIGVFGQKGDFMDNFEVTIGSATPLALEPQSRNPSDSLRKFSVCVDDTVFLMQDLRVTGGSTPYQYAWDLDGDGAFDDSDRLDHPASFHVSGEVQPRLRVRDDIGQELIVDFEVNVFARDTARYDVPIFNLFDETLQFLSVCVEDQPFEIVLQNEDLVIESDSALSTDNIFDPTQNGTGTYPIFITGDACTEAAVLIIDVSNPPEIGLATPDPLFLCASTYVLDDLLLEDAQGFWLIDDTIQYFRSTLDSLEVGNHKLTFVAGASACIAENSVFLEVMDAPDPTLKDLEISLTPQSPAFDLDTFFTPSTTLNGTWSGGAYITSDGKFDPSSLNPGTYPVIYTIGAAMCRRSFTVDVVVRMTTSIDQARELLISIYPNPNSGHCRLEAPGFVGKHVEVILVDITAAVRWHRKLMMTESLYLDPEVGPGVYMIKLTDGHSSKSIRLIVQ